MRLTNIWRIAALTTMIAVVGLGLALSRTESTRAGALGGPVVIGGDDLTDHGSVNGGGTVIEGWLYIRIVLQSFSGNTSRGDGSIAALGSIAAAETNSGNAGAAIGAAAQEAGMSVTYYDGDVAINQFFADLGGAANPSIIWIAGTGASNDLDAAEGTALTTNASAIASFVASGGGLFSHGSEFGWLSALLPGATAPFSGSSGDLYFTPEGALALTGLAEADINIDPWHNHFEGDFGGLDVLVRSNDVNDTSGADAAVILGGTAVTFEEQPAEDEAGPCIPTILGLPCDPDQGSNGQGTGPGSNGGGGGGGGGGGTDNNATTGSPTALPPTAVPPVAPVVPTVAPAGARLGTITAPDTGTGDATGTQSRVAWLIAMTVLATAGAATLVVGRKLRD
jgi:hypothetical protein